MSIVVCQHEYHKLQIYQFDRINYSIHYYVLFVYSWIEPIATEMSSTVADYSDTPCRRNIYTQRTAQQS